MNFDSKVAVITGSSAGIGAEAAKKITAMGGRVTINYSKSKEAAEEVEETDDMTGLRLVHGIMGRRFPDYFLFFRPCLNI